MLSFRDRFFTPKVARAMVSPSAIVAAGGGGAAGVVAGGFGGPAGMVVGGLIGAVAAWSARVGLAIPKEPHAERIDPFTLSEPWRRLSQDALAAKQQFDDAVTRTRSGPTKDRLAAIGHQIDDSVTQAWASARAGHALADARSRIDVASAERERDEVYRRRQQGLDNVVVADATLRALQAQLATAKRMDDMIEQTKSTLALLNARLDEAVVRSIELSVGAFLPDEFTEVESSVGSITDELEALRTALEDTSDAEDAVAAAGLGAPGPLGAGGTDPLRGGPGGFGGPGPGGAPGTPPS